MGLNNILESEGGKKMNRKEQYNDNMMSEKYTDKNMTQRNTKSYLEIIQEMQQEDLTSDVDSWVKPILLAEKNKTLKRHPYLKEAMQFKEDLYKFSIEYDVNYKNPKPVEEAKQVLEGLFEKYIPSIFNTDQYILYIDKMAILNMSDEKLSKDIILEKQKDIHARLAAKYDLINKGKYIYKKDLKPVKQEGLYVIPIQYNEYRHIIGFVALKDYKLAKKADKKALFLKDVFWDTFSRTFKL